MLTFAALVLLYFLPSIIAHNKPQFLPIFLLNFLLGWTGIGWIAALVWSLLAQPSLARVVVNPVRFCCGCGAPTGNAHCPTCGRIWGA